MLLGGSIQFLLHFNNKEQTCLDKTLSQRKKHSVLHVNLLVCLLLYLFEIFVFFLEKVTPKLDLTLSPLLVVFILKRGHKAY